MRKVISVLTIIICIFLCGCYDTGAVSEEEYYATFSNIYGVKSTFLRESTTMETMMSTSDLESRVSSNNYRFIAVQCSSSVTISECAFYLYSETDCSFNYTLFTCSSMLSTTDLQRDDVESESTLTYDDDESKDIYDGQIFDFSLPSSCNILKEGSGSLIGGQWDSFYETFAKTNVQEGGYFCIIIHENNDYKVSITTSRQETDDVTDDYENVDDVIKYYKTIFQYKFSLYDENDITFTFDKIILYVVSE